MQRYLDGEGQEVAIKVSCSYAVKPQASGDHVAESCKSPETAIKNLFWFDPEMVWAPTPSGKRARQQSFATLRAKLVSL